MKKLLLTALLCGVTAAAFGQGMVQFRNYLATTTPPINAPVYLDTVGSSTLLSGANTLWRAALVGGTTAQTPWGGAWGGGGLTTAGTLDMLFADAPNTLAWVNFRSGSTPPIAAGFVNVGGTAQRVIPNVNWAGQAQVQMVAWEGNFTTWAAAWAAAQTDSTVKIGVSNPLTLTLPTAPNDVNLTYLWGLQPFAIQVVPEPATFALAGLGAAALLIFRRRS